MDTTNIISNPTRVWAFVREYLPINASSDMRGIGLERDGELIAGVLYEGWNGVNVWMHVAVAPGKRWTLQYLRQCFHYPFVELNCSRVSGYVEASNLAARKFDEHLGFEQEAVLHGAAADGGDVILYVMRRENCRYVDPQ